MTPRPSPPAADPGTRSRRELAEDLESDLCACNASACAACDDQRLCRTPVDVANAHENQDAAIESSTTSIVRASSARDFAHLRVSR